jgi:glyoxylase-like metal-dependent hydrolase (beta-lactamase superfamily II)
MTAYVKSSFEHLTIWIERPKLEHPFEQGVDDSIGQARVVTDIVSVVDDGLGNSSYLVDLGDGRALVVDPARHPGAYLHAARHGGLEVAYAAETHLHADFVSGVCELRALGAQVIVPAGGGHAFPAERLGGGGEVDLGGLSLRALSTPGHTLEHVAYLLADGARPVALFSGGSLLVGAVARTDLISPDRTEELARALWRSLRDQLLVLPDDVPVYPTHGAGSFCSAPAGGDRTTTIGREKVTNPLLAARDEDLDVAIPDIRRVLQQSLDPVDAPRLRRRRRGRQCTSTKWRAQGRIERNLGGTVEV